LRAKFTNDSNVFVREVGRGSGVIERRLEIAEVLPSDKFNVKCDCQLKTSLGKALSRKKDSMSSSTSATTSSSTLQSPGLTHATSLPTITPPHSTSNKQHIQQSVTQY